MLTATLILCGVILTVAGWQTGRAIGAVIAELLGLND